MSSTTAAAASASASEAKPDVDSPSSTESARRRRAQRQRRILASGTDRLNRIRATFSGDDATAAQTGVKSRPASGRATPRSRPTTPYRERSPDRMSNYQDADAETSFTATSMPIEIPPPLNESDSLGDTTRNSQFNEGNNEHISSTSTVYLDPAISPAPHRPLMRTSSSASLRSRQHTRRPSVESIPDAGPMDDSTTSLYADRMRNRHSRRPSLTDAMNDAIRSLSVQMMQPSLSARHVMDDHEFNQSNQYPGFHANDDWMPGMPMGVRSRRGSDASVILMQEMAHLGQFASLLPPELANMASGGIPPFLPAESIETMDTKRRRRQWQLLHFITVLVLSLIVASSLFSATPSSPTISTSATSNWLSSWFSGTPLFYMFLTVEIGLQSFRLMFDKRLAPRIIQLQTQSSHLSQILALASRYKLIWNTFLLDFCVLLFVVGMAVVWAPQDTGGH
ncbi:hypothetical protein BDF22DRAFT_742582 [Syncephalis plumigaleata]|nr:hypothetical protein BDF22DRAFT_742582 [Syncephalis plumigaleata]